MRMRRFGRSIGAMSTGTRRAATALTVVTVFLAACTSDSGVQVEQSMDGDGSSTMPTNPSSSTSVPNPGTSPDTVPDRDGPPGSVVAPDPARLPELGGGDPDTATGTLDNGLRYLVRSNDNPGGKVELRLVVDAGSGLEADDQVGGAHFLEHMLFNGTERFPKNELIDVLRSFGAAFGADINASTSYDETIYTLNVPDAPEAVGTALDILEDWLSAATLDPVDVEAERGIVLDEWRARTETSSGRVFDRFATFLLAGSPYEGHIPIGGREAIETITPDALRRYYDDWYRPDNAAIVVVGDIDAAAIVEEIATRFSDVESRGADPERVDLLVEPSPDARVEIVDDPDLAEGFVALSLPSAVAPTALEAEAQRSILDGLALDIVATRLDNDALRGDAPFERASAGSSSFVRLLTAPEITVDTDGSSVVASVTAIVDEFERVARFGVTPAELERAIASRRAATQRNFDGRESRQDTSFADEYTRHVLEGEWYVPAQREYDFVNEVLDRATAETVAFGLVDLYRTTGAHAFVAVPTAEAGDVVDSEVIVDTIVAAAVRDLEPRPDDEAIGDSLIERPDPVEEVSVEQLATDPFTSALDPTVLEFANGARVSLNTTDIVDNEVFLSARSPGGLSFVPDGSVADGQALGAVVADSGAGEFDPVALAAFLDDKSVALFPEMTPLTNEMSGTASTADLEVLFQLVHLLMTDPRVDQTAVDRYVDDELPFALDPTIDAGYAEFDALLDARYDDVRYLLPTPESLASADVTGIEELARGAFGLEQRPWSFALSGDFDIDEVTDLARRYIGSIPNQSTAIGTQRAVEPPPPPGVVVAEAEGGQGDTANVSFLFTGTATSDRRDDVIASVVRELVGNRLTDFIREELGDSYSPFAQLDLGDGAQPSTELYISVSTAPDLVDDVSSAVLGQLDELRTEGSSEREFSNAVSTVAEKLNFINNVQINEEVLDVLVDPDGNASFDDFVDGALLIDTITEAEVADAFDAWIDLDRYIEVRVTPRA
ncbi:MAG: insulinase family protein [Ilumatobacter sp.]|uniref:M16 family metallopeptidase n=1 Tax=Ilumatobacter sp. TaxID=1967498 RepID=UPI003299C2B8